MTAGDTDLTTRGLPPRGQGRVLLIACGALALSPKA